MGTRDTEYIHIWEDSKIFKKRIKERPVYPYHAIRLAAQKAIAHPGEIGWVAKHGGSVENYLVRNKTSITKSVAYSVPLLTECVFAAALVEDGVLCETHFVGTMGAEDASPLSVTEYFGFPGLAGPPASSREMTLGVLKAYLLLTSGEFLDRAPLYINHWHKNIQILAKDVLTGKKLS